MGLFLTQNKQILRDKSTTIAASLAFWGSISKWAHSQMENSWYDGGFLHKNNKPTVDNCIDCRFCFGAPEGTRTHTLKAREPKSRMSTNSITGAYLVLGERATNGTAKPSLRWHHLNPACQPIPPYPHIWAAGETAAIFYCLVPQGAKMKHKYVICVYARFYRLCSHLCWFFWSL